MDLEKWWCRHPFLGSHSRYRGEHFTHTSHFVTTMAHCTDKEVRLRWPSWVKKQTTDKSVCKFRKPPTWFPISSHTILPLLEESPSSHDRLLSVFPFFWMLLGYKNTTHFLALWYFPFIWYYTWRTKLGYAA